MDTTRMILAIVIIIGVIYYLSTQSSSPTDDKKTDLTTPPPLPPIEAMYTTYDTTDPSIVKNPDSRVWQVFRTDSDGKITDLQYTMTLNKDSTIKTTIPSDIIQLRDLKYTGNSWSGVVIASGEKFGPFPLEFKESQNKVMMYLKDGKLLFLLAPVPPPTTAPAPTTPKATSTVPTGIGGLTAPPKRTAAPTSPPPVPPPFYGEDRYSYPIVGRYITIYKELWDAYKASVDNKMLQFDKNSMTTLVLSGVEIYDMDNKNALSRYTQVYTSGNSFLEQKDSTGTVTSTINTLRNFLSETDNTIVQTNLDISANNGGGFGAFIVIDLGSNIEISRVVLKGNLSYDTIFTIFADPDPKVYIADNYYSDICSKKLVTNACKYPYPDGAPLPTLPADIKSETALKAAATSPTASPELKTYYNYWEATNKCKLTCGFDLGKIGISPKLTVGLDYVQLGRNITIKTDLKTISNIMPSKPHLVAFQMRMPNTKESTYFLSEIVGNTITEKLKNINVKKALGLIPATIADFTFSPYSTLLTVPTVTLKYTYDVLTEYIFALNNPKFITVKESGGVQKTLSSTSNADQYNFFMDHFYGPGKNARNVALSPTLATKT